MAPVPTDKLGFDELERCDTQLSFTPGIDDGDRQDSEIPLTTDIVVCSMHPGRSWIS
jgi:hypothetical protein